MPEAGRSRPPRLRRRLAAFAVLALVAEGAGLAILLWLDRPPAAVAPAPEVGAALERGWRRLREHSPEGAAAIAPAVERALTGRGDPGAALAGVRFELAAAALSRSDAERRWRALEPVLAAAVELAAERAAEPGLERREARWVERARYRLAAARRRAADGDLDGALELGRQVQALADNVDVSHRRLLARFSDPAELRSWRSWTDAAITESRRSERPVIVIDKLARELHLLRRGRRLASFGVELGSRGLERKLHRADRATPEGRYRVVAVKTGGRTRYYKALLLDYPNADDLARLRRAKARGEIAAHLAAGGLIEIHGRGGQGRDWTDGCVALTDRDMDRLLAHAGVGTSVTIVGTAKGRLDSETGF